MANIVSTGSGLGYLKAIKELTETMKASLERTEDNTEWTADAAERLVQIEGEVSGVHLEPGEGLE